MVVGREAAAVELTLERLDAHGKESAVEGYVETAVMGNDGRWDEARARRPTRDDHPCLGVVGPNLVEHPALQNSLCGPPQMFCFADQRWGAQSPDVQDKTLA